MAVLVFVSQDSALHRPQTYICNICPQCETVSFTVFKGEMVRIQRCYLTAVVASLVRVFIVHVIWNADLCEDARMNSHVLCTLVADCLELVREAVPDSILSNLDSERWR